jgi:WD repeat-containing protein 35
VSIIVAEYIPFGANQIVQLNSNVGSTERVQGGFISPAIDEDSSGTSMEMSPEMTAVDILDYTLTNHINFEAEIRFSEDSGVVQVETFGVSLNAEGTCFYGMQVEAVMDRIKDNISLDHLARLLVDVQQDSSSIVDSIISQYLTNNFLLTVQVTYNRLRVNNRTLAFSARDLQKRLMEEFNTMKIWDAAGEDHSATALAIDKRRALEEREAAEAEGDGEEG